MIKGVELDKDEEIVAVVRKSVLLELSRFIFGLVWIFLPFFFFFPLLKLELIGILFFILIVATGFLYLFRIWNMWRLSILIVTDRRVIDLEQVGLFKTEIHELRCMKIKSVKTKKIGVIGLFNLGAIRIYSKKSQKYDIEFYGVKNPDHVRELLLEVKCLRRGHLKKVKEQSDPKPKTIVHEREETSISDSE